ncbi:MarR family transcriptional regulator [Antricoccus suffuscus]|uniref:MarR family transcriptional regulator n=1 Tax=Antricoccus suffuscus TaxID=1629062 RepID=A0A2T1A689_9ACTN|nr:MarR family transcriptional regulator [Antricoccus suffuscus]PRZ44074.1 MarR family transcriptional regulator [Antricoccus suffuscus]
MQVSVEEFTTAVLTASRVLVGVSGRSLAEIDGTITPTQFRTLVVLSNNGEINMSTLADALAVNSSTAMRMVDRLITTGLVDRRDSPHNRREVLVRLTPTGARVVRRVTSRRRTEIAKIVAAMPTARRTELIAALRAFTEAAGEPDPRHEVAETMGW